jgi:hypothetical protein
MEEWKDIKDYEGKYQVSSLGRIRSLLDCGSNVLKEPKVLKDAKNNRDYHLIVLCKNGIRKSFLVHRLVGIAFIENPENKLTIDHIDKNKSNNQMSNLRWATNDEQLENKEQPQFINSKPGTTGEKYIHITKNGFRVYNKRNNPILAYFKTKEEAVKFRNEYLETN